MAKNKSGGSPFFTGMDSFSAEQGNGQVVAPVPVAPVTPAAPQTVAPIAAAPAAPAAFSAATASQPRRDRTRKSPRERRSVHMNFLVKPSTVNSLKAIAEREDRSMNDIINELLERYIQENE